MSENDGLNDALYFAAGNPTLQQSGFEIKPLAEVERMYIEMVISLCQGNLPKAAEVLDVSPSTLYRKKSQWETGSQER